MSYPQPGPYGQQPPPNPYGQGGAPGQPGYGYPQQPPAPYGAPPPPPPPPGTPYGAPPQQAGWGQPPAPQPQGWGQQPGMPGGYPPQQSGGGAGKAIGITVGVLVVVGAIVGGVLFLNGGGSGGSGDVKPYTIDLPVAVLDGKFVEAPVPAGAQQNQPQSLADNEQAKAAGIENGTSVSKRYTNPEKQGLSVGGTYGTISDPKKTVDSLLAQADERQKKITGASSKIDSGPWTDYSPSGFDGAVMKCRTQKITITMGQFSSEVDSASCVWGDTSAVGSVSHQVSKSNSPYGAAAGAATGNVMSTQELSDATAKIRNQVRKEK